MHKIYRDVTFVLIAILLLFSACTPDNETTGDDRDSFTGGWTCRDSSKSTGDVQPLYSVNIAKSGTADTVIIYNFYNLGGNTSVMALVSGNSIVIPSQTDDSYLMSGSGLFSHDAITINYTAKLGNAADNGTAVYSR
ncbi:MAG TPA: hypothetical protein PKN14_02850 [Bacteroidia bacterium]|nr:hypothetical protein [Bacteroidia bacterium]HNR48167.1 hypothetical protein [Bacteroidia bacterium]HNT81713.1 hypothetical protein [Bacteroidia bacterium]